MLRTKGFVSSWIEEDGVFSPTHSFSKTRTLRGVVDDFV
jgi:hypothetical protein